MDRDKTTKPKSAKLPDNNPKTAFGVLKPGTFTVPPTSIIYLGQVHKHGADKYGAFNWRKDGITASIYYDAMMRHLFAWQDGEDIDNSPGGSGLPNLAHVMACCSILLDARNHDKINDDRPTERAGISSLIDRIKNQTLPGLE